MEKNLGAEAVDDPNVHIVTRTEYHYLPLCPCEACRLERHRRGLATSASSDSRIRTISMDAAEVLFGISRHPDGSLTSRVSRAASSSKKENSNE